MWRNFHKDLMPQKIEDIDIVVNICERREDGDSITVDQLVASCTSPRNTVLRRLHALISHGIVSMKAPLTDRRFRELSLTKKGVGLVRKVGSGLKRLGTAIRTGA
jgi:hypothetical protein